MLILHCTLLGVLPRSPVTPHLQLLVRLRAEFLGGCQCDLGIGQFRLQGLHLGSLTELQSTFPVLALILCSCQGALGTCLEGAGISDIHLELLHLWNKTSKRRHSGVYRLLFMNRA